MLSIYMGGMLQSEIATRQKQHILDTAGIDEEEAKLKSKLLYNIVECSCRDCQATTRLKEFWNGGLRLWLLDAGCHGCQDSLALQSFP